MPPPGSCRTRRVGFAFAAQDLVRGPADDAADECGLGAYDSTIALNGAEIATASVNVYEPPDFAAFLREQVAP